MVLCHKINRRMGRGLVTEPGVEGMGPDGGFGGSAVALLASTSIS